MSCVMLKAVLFQSSLLIGRRNGLLIPVVLPLNIRLYSMDVKRQQEDLKKEKKLAKKLAALAAEPPVPEYFKTRSAIWKELKFKHDEDLAIKEQQKLKIKLNDGKIVEGTQWETTPFDVAKDISPALAADVYVAKVNNELWDLSRPLEVDCRIELLKFEAIDSKTVFWKTTAFTLAEALERVYGVDAGGLLGNINSTQTGFFADIHLKNKKLTKSDIATIEAGMNKILFVRGKIERIEASKCDSLQLFEYNQFKLHSVNEIPGDTIPLYRCGDFIDVCHTPLMRHNKKVKAFKLLKVESVSGDTVQRVHGISFPSVAELNNFIKKKRL